jgi:hypothetical protein
MLEVFGWLVAADAIAALAIALAIYFVGKRSRQPVPVGKTAAIAVFLTLPAVLLYVIAWAWLRLSAR